MFLNLLGSTGKWKADAFPGYLLPLLVSLFLHSLPNNTDEVFYIYQVYSKGLKQYSGVTAQ